MFRHRRDRRRHQQDLRAGVEAHLFALLTIFTEVEARRPDVVSDCLPFHPVMLVLELRHNESLTKDPDLPAVDALQLAHNVLDHLMTDHRIEDEVLAAWALPSVRAALDQVETSTRNLTEFR